MLKAPVAVVIFVWLTALIGGGQLGAARAGDAPRMSIETLVDLLPSGRVVVIDTRLEGEFGADEGTIAGALRGDPSHVESWAPSVDREKIIVVFCS